MSTKIFEGDVSSKMGHFMFDLYMDMTAIFMFHLTLFSDFLKHF